MTLNPDEDRTDPEGMLPDPFPRGEPESQAEESPKYKIGEYTFDSFHEYRRAQEDLEKIEIINRELDPNDPAVAIRIYRALRDGEIIFHSPIGDEFSQHIYDLVAEDSEGLVDERLRIETGNRRTRHLRMAGLAVVLLSIGLFAYFGFNELSEISRTRRLAKLQEQVSREEKQAKQSSVDTEDTDEKKDGLSNGDSTNKTNPFEWREVIDASSLELLPAYRDAYDENQDLAGWIEIGDTEVNNPVVQRGEDNEFYLNHDFNGEETEAGCLFMDYRSDIVNPHTNTIIYGHNMKDGSMFGSLRSFLDEEFFDSHKMVTFNTIFEERRYEIQAVCLSEVAYQDENSFRYYDFIQAENQEDWDAFKENIQRLSVYEDEILIEPGDELLTLSTCNNYIDDGRLFLVAKRLK